MADTTVVGVRVAQERKERLEGFVDDTDEYRSLPDLFRTAVAHEMSDDYGRHGAGSGGSAGAVDDDRLASVEEGVRELQNTVEKLIDAQGEVAREMRMLTPEGVSQTMPEVLGAVPAGRENAVPEPEIAERVDADRSTVHRALIKLSDDPGTVHQDDDGKWYKEA
jgi:hypothetical protein